MNEITLNNSKPKDLAPIVLPHGPAVESVAEYFRSRKEDTLVKRLPVWDVVRPTPAVLREQARRELSEAEVALSIGRQEAAVRRTEMDAKWEELRQKEVLLKQSFISFNKFIRENREKRARAERRMMEDTAALERRARETEELKVRVHNMEEVRTLMEKQVKDYAIYEDYLNAVIQCNPEFKSPMDVLNRYEALAAAKAGLAARQERELKNLEDARADVARLAEEKKLLVMGLNNDLANLRWKYDKARNRVLKWELALNRLMETAAQKELELCRVREAIWALYKNVCKQKGIPVSAKLSDFDAQLVVIMRGLIELRQVTEIARAQIAAATTSDSTDCTPSRHRKCD